VPTTILRLLFVLVLSLTLAGVAAAQSIQLRWVPPTTPGVVGYNVYIAPTTTGPIATTPIDVGRPATDATGVVTATVTGNRAVPLSIEMTSYDSLRRESARSNRVSLVPSGETLGAAVFSADFQTAAIGSSPSLFIDRNGDFVVVATGTNRALSAPTGTSSTSSRYLGSGSAGWTPYEISGRVFIPSTGRVAGLAVRVGLADLSRSFLFGGDSRGVFALEQRGYSPLRCASSSSTGVSVVGNVTYRLRLRFTKPGGRARLRAKAWRATDAEPSAWQSDCWTDVAIALDSGSFALYREGSGAATFDDLVVRPVLGTFDPIP